MEGLRQYILTVAAAGILCAILRELLPKMGSAATLLKLVSGIFLAFVVISPIRDFQITDLSQHIDSFSQQGEVIAASGTNLGREAMAEIIKAKTEAYILDKAQTLGASLTVEVTLNEEAIPRPCSVRIVGTLSPYVRTSLETILENELGIAKENQTWIGSR